ncbi:tubulin tyrosine ligase protein 12 [Echinococcus multilocularis]|uniref:Tubulin tyrosine ligase protein 12 n=1 Tax=Echinococcus multilocularis TaxID=6211 RepID=A0A087VWV6_ECHMU|nr:tubulin tyrosine ligase protein 12 [Echinococcus multilocularis]
MQFSLDHFDDYTKHFIAVNYREADELLHIRHTDFIQAFEKYPSLQWKDIEMKIYKTLGGGVLGSHYLSTTSRSGRLRQVTLNVTRWICFWSGGKGGKAPLPIAL